MIRRIRTDGRAFQRPADEGAIAIIFAAVAVVGLLLLAFGVDRGLVYYTQSQLQSAVDSGATAGAQEACKGASGNPIGVATTYANRNAPSGSTISVDAPVQVNGSWYINVRGNTSFPTFFGGVSGSSRVAVAAQATSASNCIGNKGFAIFAATTLDFNGGLEVYGGIYGGLQIQTSGAGTNMHVYQAPRTDPPIDGPVVSCGTVGNFADGDEQPHTCPALDPVQYATDIGVIKAITDNNALPGKVSITGNCAINLTFFNTANVATNDARKAAKVIYCSGNADVTGPLPDDAQVKMIEAGGTITLAGLPLGSVTKPLLFHTEGGVEMAHDLDLYGTVYAPNADVTINGGPHLQVSYGELILAFFRVNGNGGQVNLDTSNSPYGSPAWSLIQ